MKLAVQQVSKQFQGNPDFKLNYIDFEINDNEFIGIIGKNGSGKSTLLSLITGYENYDSGSIRFNGNLVQAPPITLLPGVKGIKIIHQDLKLIQHYTVRENLARQLIAYQKNYKIEKVKEYLQLFKLENVADLKIEHISGGQKQKLAIANALIEETELLILDEPFNNLDESGRNELLDILLQFKTQKNIACIVVSHQVADVLMLCDKILLLENGNQLAYNDTKTLYRQSENENIARFFGEINQIKLNNQVIKFRPNECIASTCEQSDYIAKAVIKSRFFNGKYFIYIAETEFQMFTFYHFQYFSVETLVYWKIQALFE